MKKVNLEQKEDGVFWMSIDDFRTNFISVHVCKYNDEFKFSSYPKKEGKEGYHIFGIHVSTDGMYTFSVSQRDKLVETENYKYSSCRFILVRLVNDFDLSDGVHYICGKQDNWERDYYLECKHLERGKYMAFVEFDWYESVENRQFNFTSYGASNVNFCDETSKIHKEDYLKAAFVSKLEVTKEGLHYMNMESKGAPMIHRYLEVNYPEGYIYIIIDNQDPEAIYKETLEFDKFEKLEMCKPHEGQKF